MAAKATPSTGLRSTCSAEFFFPWKINESCSCLLQVLIWVQTSMCRKMTLPQKSTSNAAKVVKGKGLLKRMQENK